MDEQELKQYTAEQMLFFTSLHTYMSDMEKRIKAERLDAIQTFADLLKRCSIKCDGCRGIDCSVITCDTIDDYLAKIQRDLLREVYNL